jgi:hypothetical protein
MGPGRLTPYPPRIWTVDIRTHGGAVTAECRACGPVREHGTQPHAVRRNVISHLARHARRDLTPAHFRTCQCGRSGCPWHRRHRDCTGPVRLALTFDAASYAWRLADLCHQCCQATKGTTLVPHASAPSPEQAPAKQTPPSAARPSQTKNRWSGILPEVDDGAGPKCCGLELRAETINGF